MVVREFKTDRELYEWLNNEANLVALKAEYPPAEYSAHVDMPARQVHVVCKVNLETSPTN